MLPIRGETLQQGIIRNEYDLTDLGIIDWSGLNGVWRHSGDAIRTVSSWFINRAAYTIIQSDLRQAPSRDDWPGWAHVGCHERLA